MSRPDDPRRIALSCVGLGRVYRGFERHFSDVYANLKDTLPLTVFQGGPGGPGIRLPSVPSSCPLLRPLSTEAKGAVEFWSYLPSLLVALRRGRFALVNLSDTRMAKFAKYLPRSVKPTPVLFTNGTEAPAWIASAFDFVHCVTPEDHEAAVTQGIDKERLFLLPHGVDTSVFRPASPEEKAALRAAYGVPRDAFVVGTAGLVGTGSHKRPLWVIREIEQTPQDVFLFLAGEQDESAPRVEAEARRRLGDRVAIRRLDRVNDVYGLSDVFVLGSLHEGFGIATVEAMASGLPVIVHDAPRFRWIVGDAGSIVDMAAPGALAGAVAAFRDSPDRVRAAGLRSRAEAEARFGWDRLKPEYARMFQQCLDLA